MESAIEETSAASQLGEPRSPAAGILEKYLLIGVLALLVAGTITGIVLALGMRWDFANYYDAAHKVLIWQIRDLYDPTVPIAGQPALGNMGYLGVPISALLFAPLGLLRPEAALVVFKIQNTLAYFAGLLLLYRHCRPPAGGSREIVRHALLFASLALLWQPFWSIYRVGGQATPTVFLCFAGALLLFSSRRYGAAAALMVLMVSIKPAFGPGLMLLALISGRRFFLYTAGWGALTGILSVAVMGWETHLAFVEALKEGASRSVNSVTNSAVTVVAENVLEWLNGHNQLEYRWVVDAFRHTIRLLVLALFGRLLWRSRLRGWGDAGSLHFRFLLAITFGLLMMPLAWEHYLALLFVPLAYWASGWRLLSRQAVTLLAATFVSGLGQNLVLALHLRFNFNWDSLAFVIAVGLVKSAPLMLTGILLARHDQELCSIPASHYSPRGDARRTG